MNSWFQVIYIEEKVCYSCFSWTVWAGGTVAVLVYLSCRPAARSRWCCCCVPFSADSGVYVAEELVQTGTGGVFWGGDLPCPLISNRAYTVYRWVLEVQWGLCSRTQNVVLLLEIIYEHICTVPIRCKHCETSWWEVMLYFHLCLTFWRLTPLKDVFFLSTLFF